MRDHNLEIPPEPQNCPSLENKNSTFKNKIDDAAGFAVLPDFERFKQANDMFNRTLWDSSVQSKKAKAFFEAYTGGQTPIRKMSGFALKDYALRNAAWHLADFTAGLKEETEDRREGFLDSYSIQRPVSEHTQVVDSPGEMSRDIKRAAKFLGADLVGICEFDERWLYAQRYSRRSRRKKPLDLPTDLPYVIVIAVQMDHELVQTNPSALSGAASGIGYSRQTLTLLSLAQYIRNLGYGAIASMNDTALTIPLAIAAGLGEYSRMGLLITKEFGPRVRLGKIFTNLPLTPDQPMRFGVKEFCEICQRCVKACPMRAIFPGPPVDQPRNQSNLQGVRKWSIDAEKCFHYWVNQNSECSICMRACPYNKEYAKRYARIGRWLAGTLLRRVMLKLDGWLGFGQRRGAGWWWRKS
ncbi:MAG TPA: reductive dehalogenase [bacterium]